MSDLALCSSRRHTQLGSVLMTTMAILLLLSSLAVAGLLTTVSEFAIVRSQRDHHIAFEVAEAGLTQAMAQPDFSRLEADGYAVTTSNVPPVEVRIRYQGHSIVPVGGYSLQADRGVAAFHFVATAAAMTTQQAPSSNFAAIHEQGFYLLGASPALAMVLPSLPAAASIDLNGDGVADRRYALDPAGQLWRYEFANPAAPAIATSSGVIARLTPPGNHENHDVPLQTGPLDVALIPHAARGTYQLAIRFAIGSQLYSIHDPRAFVTLSQDEIDTYTIVTDDDLAKVSFSSPAATTTTDSGWRLALPPETQSVSPTLTIAGDVYFAAASATAPAADVTQRIRYYRVAADTAQLLDVGALPNVTAGVMTPVEPTANFRFQGRDCDSDSCRGTLQVCFGGVCLPEIHRVGPELTFWTSAGPP